MRWIDTQITDEASSHSEVFLSTHRDALQKNEFWADKIKELKGEPEARLRMALANLPLPAAFREAAVALRAMIRSNRKKGSDYRQILVQLYNIAAYDSMMIDYAPRLQKPGYNVMESIPGKLVTGLSFSYDTLGYLNLRILNKTDVKWFLEEWGEPARHTTLNEMHRGAWDRYEDLLLQKAAKKSDRLMDVITSHQQSVSQSSSHSPKKVERKWWKFWQ